MTVHNIKTKAEFYDTIQKHPSVVLDCFATWCGPCKAIAPILAKHSNEKDNQGVHFVKIDVDELPDLSQELGIRAMPTFMLFENGEKAQEIVGANPPLLAKVIAATAEKFPPVEEESKAE